VSTVRARAAAKINLHLGVGDVRKDGFHELVTVYHAVSLYDEIVVTAADELRVEVVGEGAGEDLVMPLERCGRIAIERCPNRACKRVQIHLLGVEDAVAVSEVVHRTLS